MKPISEMTKPELVRELRRVMEVRDEWFAEWEKEKALRVNLQTRNKKLRNQIKSKAP